MAQSPQRARQHAVEPEWVPLPGAGPYADMARITTGDRHVLITFGQSRPGPHPGGNTGPPQIVTVAQVYLPHKTAGEFLAILSDHIVRIERKTGQRVTPAGFEVVSREE